MHRWPIVIAVVLLSGSMPRLSGAHGPHPPRAAARQSPVPTSYRPATVTWLFKTPELRQLVRHSDRIVVAEFEQARAGRTAAPPSGGTALEFELNDFLVHDSLKGGGDGTVVTVERLLRLVPPNDPVPAPPVAIDGEGGPFEHGVRYLLFLKRQPGSESYYVINDEARYEIRDEERLHLRAHGGPIGKQLRGRPWSQARAIVRAHLQN
jgi:hypothetical protein